MAMKLVKEPVIKEGRFVGATLLDKVPDNDTTRRLAVQEYILGRRLARYESALAQAKDQAGRDKAPKKWAGKVKEFEGALKTLNADVAALDARIEAVLAAK